MDHADASSPLSRRDLLKLGAAAASVPFLALPAPQAAPAAPLDALPLPSGPTLEGADHPEARGRSINNLKFLALALHNYASIHGGRLPAAAIRKEGMPLLSWRVVILPYLEQFRLYEAFRLDEPWDSPHNLALLDRIPDVYAPVVARDRSPSRTYYQAIVGPGALFDGEEGAKLADSTYLASPTLMIVEGARAVPWTRPEDVVYAVNQPLPRLGGQFADGTYVSFADGSARFLSRNIAPETIRALFAPGNDQAVGFAHLGPWNRHREWVR